MRSAAAALLLAAPALAARVLTATFCDDAVCTVGCSAVGGAEGDCIPVDGTDFSVINVLEGSSIRTDMYAGSNCEVFVTAISSPVDTCLPGSSLPIPGLAQSYTASASRAAPAGSVALGQAVKARAVGVLKASLARNATRPHRRATLRISDCTPSGAPVSNIRWTAPPTLSPGVTAEIKLFGDMGEATAAPTYTLTVTYLGLPVLNHGNSGCGTDAISLPLDMGRVDMTLLNCPVAAGPIEIDAAMHIALLPPGTVTTDIKAFNDDGREALCIKAEVIG